ncbi:MAG: NADH-quinone oxidoreductase subunit N [Aquificaceae bacterium]|nr:NADH-quinone oxidoreductase subunit N [Aquificaceae bacterium]MDW8237208.1 NADH-quinone oxidoreductase subunit N [Aquificaceae bacterium]
MNLVILIPEIALSFGALIVFIAELFARKKDFSALTYLSGIFISISFLSIFWTPIGEGLGGMVESNQTTQFLKGVMYILTLLSIISLSEYYSKLNSVYTELSYIMMCALIGLSLLVSSQNLALSFLALELYSISSYVMIGLFRQDVLSKEASFKYLTLGSVATALIALGAGFFYLATGSFELSKLSDQSGPAALACTFLLSGIALKIAAAPFHVWMPDTYEGAPSPVVGFLSSAPKVALFGFLLNLLDVFGSLNQWQIMVAALAILSTIYANLTAYGQNSVKRLLAYSSIAHAGYFLLAFADNTQSLKFALIFYITVYSFATLGTFIAIGILEEKRDFKHHILDYKGLYKTRPGISTILAIFLFSLIGLPPFALFFGKLWLLLGLISAGEFLLAIVLLVASLIGAGYYLKLIVNIFLSEPYKMVKGRRISGGEAIGFSVCLLIVVSLGLFPQIVLSFYD